MNVESILEQKGTEVVTIAPDASIKIATDWLRAKNVGALVVTNKDAILGIISERDIVRQLAKKGKDVGKLTVSDVMTTDVLIAVPDDEVTYLSNTMTNNRIRHIPVLQDGELVGIVSIGDVVKAQLDLYEGEAHYLQNYITGGYA